MYIGHRIGHGRVEGTLHNRLTRDPVLSSDVTGPTRVRPNPVLELLDPSREEG